jgi:hypothetical protein
MDSAAHFRTSFLSVSFVGLSSGGYRIGLAKTVSETVSETISVNFFRWVVIWGVVESASQRLLMGRNAQTDRQVN